ncbi:MAG: hypothetical protein ISS74_08625 [Planctomycetes bacterium]|nr:hypothetical protein [Planctomycetota bacterium]
MPRLRHLACIVLAGLAAGGGLLTVLALPVAADGPRLIAYEPFQNAETVVRAVAGETKPVQAQPVDGGTPRPITVTTFTVEKVLAGACPDRVQVLPGKHPGYRAGTAYVLCLVPSPYEDVWQGLYEGQASIRIEDGRCILPEFYWIRDDLRPLLGDFSVEAMERAVRRFRGPAMTVRPLQDAFRCDEPLGFAVTLTNPWPEAMTLVLPAGEAFGRHVTLRLADAGGFNALTRAWHSPAYGAMPPPPDEPADAKITLAPGESVTREVRFRVLLAEFRQDPQRVQSAVVCYSGSGDWRGRQYARCPVRLTCPYRRWAGDLARPAPAWAVHLGGPYWDGDARWRTVANRDDVPVYVVLERGWVHQPGRVRGYTSWSQWRPLADEASRATLAACFRVTRGGQAVAGLALQPDRVRALLDGLDPEAPRPVISDINLARYFDFSEPGQYEIRLVLPCEGGPSLSRVLYVYVPAPTAGAD